VPWTISYAEFTNAFSRAVSCSHARAPAKLWVADAKRKKSARGQRRLALTARRRSSASLFGSAMSHLGQSRPTNSTPVLAIVRFAPLTTKMLQRRERSDVPKADLDYLIF
jgi:hypothetical protein